MLPGHVIPFWKAFDKANKMLGADFYFVPIPALVSYTGGDYEGGRNFFTNWPIFHKIDPLEIQFRELIMLCNFFVDLCLRLYGLGLASNQAMH